MGLNTTVLLVRTLMLVGMISPLVIGAVVVAIGEKRRASNLDGDVSRNLYQRPVVIRTVVATRRITRRGKRIIARLLHQGQGGTPLDAVRAQPWT